jgi:hypothetical protein
LSRNLYSQFFFFATHQSTTDLEEGAKWFSETAAAKDEDPPLFLAMSSIGQYVSPDIQFSMMMLTSGFLSARRP